MGKKGDLSNFDCDMFVGARRPGISQSAQLLGFSHTTISRVYKEFCEKGKTSSMQLSCGQKCLVDARGQRRMGRLMQVDGRATLTEITTRYNRGMRQNICEATTGRRPHQVPLIQLLQIGKIGYNLQELIKIGQLKTGKMLPGLMSLDFC